MKGKKSAFNFLSDEDLKNLSAFLEGKNIPVGETLWKAEDPRAPASLERKDI
jgi:hypothetical protein